MGQQQGIALRDRGSGQHSAASKVGSSGKAGLLTKREEGVVHLVAEGLTNRDISHQLNLSEHTVRNYLFRIFNKVGTSNRLELALYAIDQRGGLAGTDELLPVTNQPRSSMDEGKTPWTECKNIARA